ncbi:MAG: FAD-dependent thymidylate synthase [Clostridia bacterium]|nr:FAD-dependent thymidylate synthase [Clostridia bacterium]
MLGKAEIVRINGNSDAIISAAGRISTTEGNADEIYARSCANDREKNGNLIKKIIRSGHASVTEHATVNISFNDVSVFVEQFMIEFRLASFTVKSRRYVDFAGVGYYVPEFENDKAQKLYREHMDYLFGEYAHFMEVGIPKEDARFVLPYSFRSNFYVTANIRELVHIIDEMLCGRGKAYPEIVGIGSMLKAQLIDKMPYMEPSLQHMDGGFVPCECNAPENVTKKRGELVTIIRMTEDAASAVCMAYSLDKSMNGDTADIIKEIIASKRRRELEQVSVTMLFNDISLAGITHMVRHRMQSIIVPEYVRSCSFDNYIIPDSITEAGETERYKATFARSREVCDELMRLGMYGYDRVYMFLSGMTVPIMTTMNANELLTFCKLRTCNRAQWEIKRYADELLIKLRAGCPELFSQFGPSCYVLGYCPEGRMTCGNMQGVIEEYSMK